MSQADLSTPVTNEINVLNQGTIVDQIEYNIQNVASSVEEGFKQLQKVLSLFHMHMYNMCMHTHCPCLFLERDVCQMNSLSLLCC